MRESLREFCAENGKEYLLTQWDTGKNGELAPDDVSRGSHARVWWKCEKGHSWQAEVRMRTGGNDCPVCSNKLLLTGENDLAVRFPKIAAEWDMDKNGGLAPDKVLYGSHRRVWWKCGKGHSWQAEVRTRTSGTGCPVCGNKKTAAGENDLASAFPDIAAEWDAEKNNGLMPDGIMPGSSKKVWWRCPRGHSYRAAVYTRSIVGHGCPYCAGRRVLAGFNDLASREPELAAEWHPSLNGSLTPETVTPGSHKKVWWMCREGHAWRAVIYSRTGRQRAGCPVCSGNVKLCPRREAGGNGQSAHNTAAE